MKILILLSVISFLGGVIFALYHFLKISKNPKDESNVIKNTDK
jgi:hypothetical protein